MFTILNAILAAANCRDQSKDGPPALRGVVIEWVNLPESDYLPERVVRCSATDGKALAVVHVNPGKGWPEHGKLVVLADSLKVLGQLVKRTQSEIEARTPDIPVRGTIETWCSAYDEQGRPINPRQVIRVDIPCADDGMILQLAGDCTPPDIENVMRPRKLTMGTPPGRLSTGYVSSAQDAVGHYGPPTWYTDGRCALLFNRVAPERVHDFALVMPVVGDDEERVIYPWGMPAGEQSGTVSPDGDLAVITGLDHDEGLAKSLEASPPAQVDQVF